MQFKNFIILTSIKFLYTMNFFTHVISFHNSSFESAGNTKSEQSLFCISGFAFCVKSHDICMDISYKTGK